MKITKKPVNACTEACSAVDLKQTAIDHIKSAMECLAVCGDYDCLESIGNLTVVLVDLTPCDSIDIEPEDVEPVETIA